MYFFVKISLIGVDGANILCIDDNSDFYIYLQTKRCLHDFYKCFNDRNRQHF